MRKLTMVAAVIIVMTVVFGVGRWSATLNNSTSTVRAKPAKATHYELQSETPVFSASEAQSHRESNYSEIKTMDSSLDLPTDFAQTEALYAMAGRANQHELESLIGQALEIEDLYERTASLRVLFSRYAELDPHACVDYLVGSDIEVDGYLFSTVFSEWSKIDLNSAIAKAKQLENRRQRKRAVNSILRITARTNRALLSQVAAGFGEYNDLTYVLRDLIGVRANHDPYGALQEAMALQSVRGRSESIRLVARVWALSDPSEALQFMSEIKDQKTRQRYVSTILARWIEDDPLQAMQFVNAHPDESERNEMLLQGLGSYTKVSPEDAMTAAEQLPPGKRTHAIQKVLSQWTKTDPDAATARVMSIDDAIRRERLLSKIGRALAMESTDKAFQWLDGMDSELRSKQMKSILKQTAQHDPRRAFEYAIANSTEQSLTANLLPIMQVVSSKDPSIVQDYLSLLPEGAKSYQVYQNLAEKMALDDSQAALQWVAGLTGRAKSGALEGLAATLSQTNPELAGTLVSQLSGKDAANFLGSISTALTVRNPQAGLAWLDQFVGHPGHTQALGNVLSSVVEEDPQLALASASKLSGEERILMTSGVLGAWARRDPTAAANWANRADSDLRAEGLSSVMASWRFTDSQGATQFALGLPTGDVKDQTLNQLISYLPGDSDQTIELIAAITSDELRQQTIEQIYVGLLLGWRDQPRANEFLNNVGASPQLREQLLSTGD